MQVLFTKIRQSNLDEVKRILEKHPDVIDDPSGPKPKKDHGQSPLQVALKTGNVEIANYLIDQGANVNFMEAEDDDPGVRMPVLFDAIIATLHSLFYKRLKKSDESLLIMKRLLEKGADVNTFTSYGEDAMNCAILAAREIITRPASYPEVQDETWNKLEKILDLLLEYGFDYKSWVDRNIYPQPSSLTSRQLYFSPIDLDSNLNYESSMNMRNFLQNYFAKRNIQF